MKKILLTFDLEEFDLPKEFNVPISEQEMYEISKQGVTNLFGLLDKYKIKATFFITTHFAKRYPKIIKDLIKKQHEIASHGYSHSFSDQTLDKTKKAKLDLEKITKIKIKGFRAPRFRIRDISKLHDLGFVYDSSLHPTLIPGRYNNLSKPRIVHKIGNIIEIPPTTMPVTRLPLFWIAFKNFGLNYAKLVTRTNFLSSDYTMIVQHPWEFADLNKLDIPNYIKKKSGKDLLNLLEDYIIFCKKRDYKFSTVSSYLNL